ncbi:hypothetical protein UFOVP273_82 [uncultured Caudovirales phage]|uniref:Uncharacterized protein n=1 Tax=uncultured Caudovirales phage TaxID=2100421 RepID=A0A6J5LM88_9CAUD|nr:hypothetical protein UFOVP273_82 [uncultured Caudovirales phage]
MLTNTSHSSILTSIEQLEARKHELRQLIAQADERINANPLNSQARGAFTYYSEVLRALEQE